MAFSPLAFGWARELPAQRLQWAPLAALAIVAIGILRGARARLLAQVPVRRRMGWALLAAGLSALLLGLAADAAVVARLGLPLSVIGLGLAIGWPRLGWTALAILAVPLPTSLLVLTSPELEGLWARLGADLAGLVGVPLSAGGGALRSATENLTLDPADGGLPICHLFAVAGWIGALRQGAGAAACARQALRVAPLGFLAQLAGTTVAGMLLVGAGWEAALRWLHHGTPAIGLLAALPFAIRGRRYDARSADAAPRAPVI